MTPDGQGCMPLGATQCGQQFCRPGLVCWCDPGYVCRPRPNTPVPGCFPGPELLAEHAEEQRKRREQRRADDQRNRTTHFDCSHRPASAGASWDAECLPAPPPKKKRLGDITRDELTRLAEGQCQSAPANSKDKCRAAAVAAIMMVRNPVVRKSCTASSNPTSCAVAVTRRLILLDELDERLDDQVRTSYPEGASVPWDGPPPTKPPTEPPPQQPAKPADDLLCTFVLYRIHQHDLAYSRLEQVPPECRDDPEIKSALSPQGPVFTMLGSETDKEIQRLLGFDQDESMSGMRALKDVVDLMESAHSDRRLSAELPPDSPDSK